MSDLFENIDQNKAFFISRDAKGKIRCIETYFDKVNDGYCIHRFSYQYGGKHTEQPSITITQGKVKRDTYAQTLLRFNAICKEYRDKGYKEIDKEAEQYTEEELDKIKEFAKFVKLQRKWLFNQIRTAFYIIRGIVQNCSN
mgnify:CR=1 FL=1